MEDNISFPGKSMCLVIQESQHSQLLAKIQLNNTTYRCKLSRGRSDGMQALASGYSHLG